MTLLHIVNKSHRQTSSLASCLRFAQDGHALLLIEDGVYELAKGQDTAGIGIKNHSKTYRALEGYDVEKLYVERESMRARGLTEDDLIVDVEVLSSAEMAALMAEQDVVLSF